MKTAWADSDYPQQASAKLDCSFELAPGQHLRIRARIINTGRTEIFLLNRLWHLSASSNTIADRQDVYRFVRNSELRLLWGIAPVPRMKTITYRNIPFVTEVKAGASLQFEEAFAFPVKEYSVYFPESGKSGFSPVEAKRVIVIVQFVTGQPNLTTTPSPLEGALEIPMDVAVDTLKSVSCSSPPVQFEVLRRTDAFDRFTMPNEAPEPMVFLQ